MKSKVFMNIYRKIFVEYVNKLNKIIFASIIYTLQCYEHL